MDARPAWVRDMSKSKKSKQKAGHDHTQGIANEEVLFDEEPYKRKMQQAVEHVYHELTGVRTGRASPSLFDGLTVEAYGEKTSLVNVGTVVARGPRTLAVTVYDAANIPAVLAAIRDSPLELNPRAEGSDVIVPVPELSPETVRAMVKLAHQFAESGRAVVRKIRQKAMAEVKANAKAVSEDDRKRIEKVIEDITKSYIASIDSALARKEAELQK